MSSDDGYECRIQTWFVPRVRYYAYIADDAEIQAMAEWADRLRKAREDHDPGDEDRRR